jgi:hypothetical protein
MGRDLRERSWEMEFPFITLSRILSWSS